MTNAVLDTIQFRKELLSIVAALETTISDPNNLRQLLFAGASSMQRQVSSYLAPMAERYASQLKSKIRAATRLENGYDGSDSQDHKAEIADQVEEIEGRLSNLNNQIDECIIIGELFESSHDRVVIETGKGDLFSDIRAKADAKREKAAREAEFVKVSAEKKTDAQLDKATGESDIVARTEAMLKRMRAA